MWQGRLRTGGDADDCAPLRGLCEEARLAEGGAASAWAGRRARVCAWGAVRAAAEGGREGAVANPAPWSQRPGRLLCEPGTAAAAAARWRDPGPRRALPLQQQTRLPGSPDAASPGLPVSVLRRERK